MDLNKLSNYYDYENVALVDYELVFTGDVILKHRRMFNLPDFKIKHIDGGFYCSHSNLVSLINGPTSVSGNYDCSSNQLHTLRNGPISVGGEFNCSYNNLTTLKYCPPSCSGFVCYGNKLSTLHHLPKDIKGELLCDYFLKDHKNYKRWELYYKLNELAS